MGRIMKIKYGYPDQNRDAQILGFRYNRNKNLAKEKNNEYKKMPK